jgi:hypothetical protein
MRSRRWLAAATRLRWARTAGGTPTAPRTIAVRRARASALRSAIRARPTPIAVPLQSDSRALRAHVRPIGVVGDRRRSYGRLTAPWWPSGGCSTQGSLKSPCESHQHAPQRAYGGWRFDGDEGRTCVLVRSQPVARMMRDVAKSSDARQVAAPVGRLPIGRRPEARRRRVKDTLDRGSALFAGSFDPGAKRRLRRPCLGGAFDGKDRGEGKPPDDAVLHAPKDGLYGCKNPINKRTKILGMSCRVANFDNSTDQELIKI